MSEFAMSVFDKAKKKAERAGVKRGSVRLEEVDETSELGLPFPAAPRNDERLTIPKVAAAIAATVVAAALVSAVAGSIFGSKADTPTASPSLSPAAPPSTSIGEGLDVGVDDIGHKNGSGGKPADSGSTPSLLPASLEEGVELVRIRDTLESLYGIAQLHGNRAMGSRGYNASVHYVLSVLATLQGFRVSVHDFVVSKNKLDPAIPASLHVHLAPQVSETEYTTMSNTGFGNVAGILIPAGFGAGGGVQGRSTGCNASEDFGAVAAASRAGFGVVALVERGSCFFSSKMVGARAAGAAAVLIYNADGGGVFSGTLGSDGDLKEYLPSFGLSSSLGRSLQSLYAECPWPDFSGSQDFLRSPNGTTHTRQGISRAACVPSYVNVSISGHFESLTSSSIIAELGDLGDDASVIVVGAHLDGVEAGPGINDNGSGSATILEIARALSHLAFPPTPTAGVGGGRAATQPLRIANRVRFCWWGGEESGLLGSRAYVKMLNATGQLRRVALNLNFDMLASPNFKTGVYNGTDAEKQDGNAVAGSTYIMQTFTSYFEAQDKPWAPSAFTGRSDYGPFLEMGIPAGGLDTGAEKIKGMEERKVFGGLARTAFDPCYHQSCDDILNINMEELGLLARAVAHTLQHLASDSELRRHLRFPMRPSLPRRLENRAESGRDSGGGYGAVELPFQGHHPVL